MEREWLLLAIVLVAGTREIESKEVIAQVNPRRIVQYVPERFLSITLDPANILLAGNLGKEALNMARGLSPSFVRLGGKSTNYMKFGKELMMDNTTITESQWDSVYKFATEAGLDLITSINPAERINGVWDSRDALQLISYSHIKGYNIAWQLGYDTEGITASGSEVGRDIVRLRKILDGFKRFAHTPIFGPDLKAAQGNDDGTFVRDMLYQAGPVLGAIFMQPDWKGGEDPMMTIMNAIVELNSNIWGKALRFGRIIPRKPLWIADGEISSGRSGEALELVKRLGSAARLGVQVVMRQLAPLTLTKPTPEFWTALFYKKLVGRGVLDARVSSGNGSEIMLYSHCTQGFSDDKSIIDAGMIYDKGAVTVFGVNELNENVKLSLKVGMKEEKVHLYSLTFADSPDGTIEETKLNGQVLTLSPTGELPIVSPRVFNRQSRSGITIPPRSVFFFVIPEVKSRMCSSMPFIHAGEAKELSKKLIQVAADVLDKPIGHMKQDEEESDKNKIYVKFGERSNSVVQSKEGSANGTGPDDSSWIDKLSGSKTVDEKAGAEETLTTEEKVTTVSVEPTTSLPDSTTASPSQEKTRRKRSPPLSQPILDMELADSNQNGLANQEELVKEFNSYAHKVYESSRSEKKTGDIQITNIPEQIFNTLKKVKVTFKYLGTTSSPEKLIEEVTEAPTSKPDSETETIDKKQEDKEEGPKEENLTEAESNEESSDESKEETEAKENTFRDSLSGDASKSPGNKGEKELQELDTGAEVEPSLQPAGSSQDERKERLPRDDALRQGESSIKSSSGQGNEEETSGNDDAGSEVESLDESSKGERNTQQTESDESLPSVSNSVSDTGSSNPPKLTAQDNKDAKKEKEKLKSHKPAISSNHISGKQHEIPDPVPKSILTTTEMPDFIKIEGIEPKKVDELLLKIAKTNIKNSAHSKKGENKSGALKVEEMNEKKSKSENEELNDAVEPEDEDSAVTETKVKQSDSAKAAEEASSGDEDEKVEDSAATESEVKPQPESAKATEEASSGDAEKPEEVTEEDETEGLDRGPQILEANGPETLKIPRAIPVDTDKTEDSVNSKLIEETSSKGDTDKADLMKDQSDNVLNKGNKDSKSSMIELVDETEELPEEEINESSREELSKTSNEQTAKGKVENPPTEAVEAVESFKNVPLNESADKSYTPPANKLSSIEKESLEEPDDKAAVDYSNEVEDVSVKPAAGTASEQVAQGNSQETSKEEQLESEEAPQIQPAVNLVPLPMQPLILPMNNPLAMIPSTVAPVANIKSDTEDSVETSNEDKNTDIKSEKLKVKNIMKELPKKMQSKAGIDQERRLKLLAIRNQIMEVREKFKAAAREEGWRAALEQREQQMKELIQQGRDKRKFFSLPTMSSDRTLLSRPRRLTYDPASSEQSKEAMYDYGSEQVETYGLPLANNCGKSCITEQVLPLDFNNPDPNHIIFPLDPKAQQAVVYNNRIIPARLYGVISVNDEASKFPQQSHKQPQDLAIQSQFQKYFKSYEAPSIKEKYEPRISEAPSLKHLEHYSIPRDSPTKSLEPQQKFIPIVVISPKTGSTRRKRSLPSFEKPIIKTNNNSHTKIDSKIGKALKKRSLDNTITTYHTFNDISRGGLTNADILNSHIISNEIIPLNLGLDKRENFSPNEEIIYQFPYEEMQSVGEPRTIGAFQPLPPPLAVLPPLPPPAFPPPPGVVKALPEAELPVLPTSDTPLFRPELKRRPDPPQVYLFTMLQDKFKSLVGLVESLADWCGAYSRK